jgi:hypothetical protein
MVGGKANVFDNQLLLLIFNGVGIPHIADNAALTPAIDFYLALHTSDPGLNGDQTTNEAAYGGYARMAVPRTTAGFTVAGNACTLATQINFATAISGTETETFFSLGMNPSGASIVLYRGPLTNNVIVSPGVEPILTTGTKITEN